MSNFSTVQKNANQGNFFFAKFLDPSIGQSSPHPVFVVGKNGDSNDGEDVIVCKCTSQPKRSDYDIPVLLNIIKPPFGGHLFYRTKNCSISDSDKSDGCLFFSKQ